MKSRSKKLIGPFILLAISLAIFAILIIALAPEIIRGGASPTETAEQIQPASTSTATAIPSTTAPRVPTFTAEGTTPADNSSPIDTTTPGKTPEIIGKLQSKIITKPTPRHDEPTPCPPWMFWCKWGK